MAKRDAEGQLNKGDLGSKVEYKPQEVKRIAPNNI